VNFWLMDVDGVLNAVPAPKGYRTFQARSFEIAFQPAVVERILALHEEGLVEVRWLTTWADDANRLLCAHFGWPSLAVAGSPPSREHGWWKSPIARAFYDAGHRVVWTDDDLDFGIRTGDADWVNGADPDRLLTISPLLSTGLSMKQVDEVEGWLRQGGPPL